jgi:hypothetical protein
VAVDEIILNNLIKINDYIEFKMVQNETGLSFVSPKKDFVMSD